MLTRNSLHSLTSSSSQANTLRLHCHASPSSPHPRENISVTVSILLTTKSKSRLNYILKLYHQSTGPTKKEYEFLLLPLGQCCQQTTYPHPHQSHLWLFHQTELLRPPSSILPPTSPYLATRTLYHKLIFSTFNVQHYLPSKVKLNSLILCLPNLHSPFTLLAP